MNDESRFNKLSLIPIFACLLLIGLFAFVAIKGCNLFEKREDLRSKAKSQVNSILLEMEGDFDPKTGLFNKKFREPENDPWGGRISIYFTTGNNYEILHVRSPGPDGMIHTKDDVWASKKRWVVGAGSQDIRKIISEGTGGIIEGIKGKK